MIKVQLSDDQRKELENFRRQASSKDSEKALMVSWFSVKWNFPGKK